MTWEQPLPHRSDSYYRQAENSTSMGADDDAPVKWSGGDPAVDVLCAFIDAIHRGLCDLHGEDCYEFSLGEGREPLEADATRAFQALVMADLIRPEDIPMLWDRCKSNVARGPLEDTA